MYVCITCWMWVQKNDRSCSKASDIQFCASLHTNLEVYQSWSAKNTLLNVHIVNIYIYILSKSCALRIAQTAIYRSAKARDSAFAFMVRRWKTRRENSARDWRVRVTNRAWDVHCAKYVIHNEGIWNENGIRENEETSRDEFASWGKFEIEFDLATETFLTFYAETFLTSTFNGKFLSICGISRSYD